MKELLIVLAVLVAVFICIKMFLKIFQWAVILAAVAAVFIFVSHRQTWTNLSDKISVLKEGGDLSGAREIAFERLSHAGSFFNLNKETYATALLDIAELYDLEKKYSKAEEYLVKAINEYEREGEDGSVKKALKATLELGNLYMKKGDLNRGVELLEDVLKKYVDSYGEGHEETLEAAKKLQSAYRAIGKMKEAKEIGAKYLSDS